MSLGRTVRHARRTLACAVAGLLVATSCATPREGARPDDPIRLLPVSAWREDVFLRQRVTIDWPGESARFDAVLEKRGDRLRLVGLGPMSIPGFVLTLEDGRVEVENRTGRPLVFDPRHILADVQRVFFPWHPRDARAARPDVTRTFERSGQRIVERFAAGELVARDFLSAAAAAPDGTAGEDADVSIAVRYDGWHANPRVPRKARVEHRRLDYRLEVETLEARHLGDPPDGAASRPASD